MPELPEVTTTVNGLNKVLKNLSITGFWTDLAKPKQSIPHFKNTIKDGSFIKTFSSAIIGATFVRAERRAKNILIHLSTGDAILIHLKMTGHLLYGHYEYDKKTNSWKPSQKEKNTALQDPYNRFIHAVFSLSNEKHLVMCDARKFGKVTLIPKKELTHSPHLENIGNEPLNPTYTSELFLSDLSKKPNGKIKQVLMDPSVVAGIGNIYSDEMLCLSGIHPLSIVGKIPKAKIRALFKHMQSVLKKGIDFSGDSTSDYRNIEGVPGNFQHQHIAYKRKGLPCLKSRCGGTMKRIIIGSRSAHFCDTHQTLWTN